VHIWRKHAKEAKEGHFRMNRHRVNTKELQDGEAATWRCPVEGCKHGLKCCETTSQARCTRRRHGKSMHPKVPIRKFLVLDAAGRKRRVQAKANEMVQWFRVRSESQHELELRQVPYLKGAAGKRGEGVEKTPLWYCKVCGAVPMLVWVAPQCGRRGQPTNSEFDAKSKEAHSIVCPVACKRAPHLDALVRKHTKWEKAIRKDLKLRKTEEEQRELQALLDFMTSLKEMRDKERPKWKRAWREKKWPECAGCRLAGKTCPRCRKKKKKAARRC